MKLKTKIGIYTLAMLSMASLVVSPVIGGMVKAFPKEDISQVQMVLSVGTLTGLVAAFIVARLAMSVPKKTIAIIGTLVIGIAGLIPYFIHSSLLLLIICSAFIGVGVGFISNTLPGLIAENFDVEERQGVLGKQVAFVSIGTMILLFLAGQFGANHWFSAYLTYALSFIVGIIAFICLPNTPVASEESGNNHSFKEVLNGKLFFIVCLGFVFMVVNNAYNNNIALLIQENNLGGSDVAGLVSMLGQLGGLIAGLLIGFLAKIARKQMLTLAFLVEGLSLVLLSFSTTIPLVIIGSFFAGVGLSLFFSQAPFLITILVSPILIPMGMALLSTFNSIGGFLSPAIVNHFNALVFSGNASGAMLAGGIVSLAAAAVTFVTKYQEKALKSIEEKQGECDV